jgi:ubiquitin carboxyl-terminal hydrolase 5/13
MLADMGFTHAQARKALRETVRPPSSMGKRVDMPPPFLQASNAERAVEWLFSHPDDNGEEDAAPNAAARDTDVGGSRELPARYRLKAFVSHKGPSVHSGHYVAHVRVGDEGEWVLFNDEKVVRADVESVAELKKLAYLYVFQRV